MRPIREPTAAHGNLYPTALGSGWDMLPAIVRRLHQEGQARGQVTIEGGLHWPARLLARILRFPPAGRDVATRLNVERQGEEQVWSRRFGEHTMVSRQRLGASGLVAERFGSIECTFRLQPTATGIDYDLVGAALWLGSLRLPLPRALGPRGVARTWAEGNAMGLDVSVAAPLLGRILRYHGRVRPEGNETSS